MSKHKKITRLEAAPDHELAEEVSFVPSGAQGQTFLLTKEGKKMNIEEILKTVLETEAENEAELDAMLEKAKDITEKQKGSLKAAFRLLNGVSDAVPKDLLKRIAALAGAEDEDEDDDDDKKPPFLQDKKKTKKAAADDDKKDPPPADKKEDDVKKSEHIVKAGDLEIDLGGLDDKARPVVEVLVKALDAKDATVAAIQKSHDELVDQIRTKEFIAKANEDFEHLPGDKTELGTLLKNLHKADPKMASAVEKQLQSSNALLKKASILGESGVSSFDNASSAWGKIEAIAKEKVSKDSTGKLTFEAAIERVMDEQPDLYTEYREEKGGH